MTSTRQASIESNRTRCIQIPHSPAGLSEKMSYLFSCRSASSTFIASVSWMFLVCEENGCPHLQGIR